MDRYRAYGPQDDQSGNVGDYGFEGANYYDRPENLQPGQVQAATNIDFTAGAAETRGGLVCIPELGAAPFDSGSNWTAITVNSTTLWGEIAYGNGVFVALSRYAGAGDLMTSSDAVTWTVRSTGLSEQWASLAFGGGKFVALALTGGGLATSTDGITWTAQTSIANQGWYAITYGEGKFVAVSNDGTKRAATSPDGITWTLQTTPAAEDNWEDVAYGNGIFVAVGNDNLGYGLMTSPDGITWTNRNPGASKYWKSVTFGGGKFVAVSATGSPRSAYSTDGINWTLVNDPIGDWTDICYGNGLFIAVSDQIGTATNKVAVSPDGITWTLYDAVDNTQWYSIVWANNTYVAVGYCDPNRTIMTSGSIAGIGSVYASTTYSDPNTPTDQWIALAGQTQVGFFAFGRTSRSVAYPANFTLSEQATLVQANNQLFLFPGEGQTPIYWDGDWSTSFAAVPDTTLTAGFDSIPESNHATYYQNRLWVVNGKDSVAASDILDFTSYDQIANSFNLNTGAADYVVNAYPFGDNSLVVFKHNSSVLLENVQGSLSDVTATEISRNLGIIGINAVTAVGPDLVYVSDRNISTIRLNLQNKLQNVTEPLSRNIGPLIGRINWQYAYKISLGYWDNRLFVAVPMDDSTVCDTILVYNFITQQWYGEWNFAPEIAMNVQGFVVANYLGQLRLHVITEDGRIFVTDQGQNDISGSTVAEISTSLTTRAYNTNNTAHRQRRMYMDIETNRPEFSVTSYTDGANESSTLLTDQTYTRSESWKWNDSTYTLTNANDDFNRAFRRDYSTGPNSVQCGSGFQPEMRQAIRLPLITRRQGRLSWLKIDNTQGYMLTRSVGFESTPGQRSSLVQV